MAGEEVAHVDEGYAKDGGPKDGPVLTMMSKRLRALRKKYNRILQIEGQKQAGKPVNKEQEEVLKTKIAIAALIDEYEKLRVPLQVAVREEVAERERELMTATLERQEEDESVGDEKEEASEEGKKEEAAVNGNSRETAPEEADNLADAVAGDSVNDQGASSPRGEEVVVREYEKGVLALEESGLRDYESPEQGKDGASGKDGVSDGELADLLKLLYFAQLFDVRSQGEAPSFVWTKVHERSSCLSYDFVTDDATSPLLEKDLDALSHFGSMLVSRPPNVTLSHKDALQRCIHHARQWLACSDDVIQDNLDVSYSRLRDRLNRILSSEYFTMIPELQTVSQQTAAAAATAAVQYVSNVLVHEGSVGSLGDVEEGSGYFGHQDQPVSQQQYYQPRADFVAPPQLAAANGLPVGHVIPANGPFVPETQGIAVDIPQFGSHEDGSQSAINPETSLDQDQAQISQPPQPQQPHKLQQHPGGPRNGGGYQGAPRGGRHGGLGGYGMGGGGRGYPNGRGGRGGRGSYPNGGRGGYYDQGNYHNRNHYGGRGGRGGRGSVYNGHANGPPAAQAPAVVAEAST